MFDEDHPLVSFKLRILAGAMPARTAVVFGDMYLVDGGFTKKCVDYGCRRALLIDTLETPGWQRTRLEHPALDFYKGDFSSSLFMKSIAETFEVGVVNDILLHQAPLLNTLHLMLEKVEGRFCIVQPMLREQGVPNTLVYLPGNPEVERLHPFRADNSAHKAFDVSQVNHTHWLWGMTVSFLTSVLAGEGFEIVHQQEHPDYPYPNPQWFMWGCVAERRSSNPMHWSQVSPHHGLYTSGW